jgi:hypothetical protein
MTAFFTSEEEIHRIGRGVIARSLPKPEWTHAAHFAAALWLMRYRPDIDPPRDMPDMIRAYNVATGVANTNTDGYHETITQASLRAARSVLALHQSDTPAFVVVNDLLAREFGRSGWLLSYWSRELLFSVAARRKWVEPDIRELPF